MKMFYTNSSAKAEITELEARISTLEAAALADSATITRITGELTVANDALSAMTTERDEAAAAITEAEATSSKATSDLATANAALNTANGKISTFDADVETAAAARFAGLGGDPLAAAGQDEKGKEALAGLTGLERATAAHKAAAAAKKGK